jgi:hypothetical protein
MKRSTFFKSLLALMTIPVMTSFAKEEEFDFETYLRDNPTVTLSEIDTKNRLDIHLTGIRIPEFKPKEVLALWRRTGKFLHKKTHYFRGSQLVEYPLKREDEIYHWSMDSYMLVDEIKHIPNFETDWGSKYQDCFELKFIRMSDICDMPPSNDYSDLPKEGMVLIAEDGYPYFVAKNNIASIIVKKGRITDESKYLMPKKWGYRSRANLA